MDYTVIDYLIAFAGWCSTWMVLYSGGFAGHLLASKLKIQNNGWIFSIAGVVIGAVAIAGAGLPEVQESSWVIEHIRISEVFFTTWSLAFLAILAWLQLIYTISTRISVDFKNSRTAYKATST